MAFCKATNLSDVVTLKVSSEYPLVVEFPVENQGEYFGYVRYYLAPKISDESN